MHLKYMFTTESVLIVVRSGVVRKVIYWTVYGCVNLFNLVAYHCTRQVLQQSNSVLKLRCWQALWLKLTFIRDKIKTRGIVMYSSTSFLLIGYEFIQLKNEQHTNVWRTNNFTKLTINEP